MRTIGVPPAYALQAWPLIAGWISAALARGKADTSPEQVRECLARGLMQLWLAWENKKAAGCCVTEVLDGARGKTCNLVVVAGRHFKDWEPLLEDIKAWARAQGCVRLQASGRAGWERYAEGWAKVRTTIEMELDQMERK